MLLFGSLCILYISGVIDKQQMNHAAHETMSFLMYGATLMPVLNQMFVMGMILSLYGNCALNTTQLWPPTDTW